MTPRPEFDAVGMAKALMRASRRGALATLMQRGGEPYCSLVNVATTADGAPILLISRLAAHTRNILADGRVSLMLDDRRAANPFDALRIMVNGEAIESEDQAVARRYLARQPEAESFAHFGDFSFFVLRPKYVHVVAGFGRVMNLKPDEFLTDLSGADALLAAEAEIVAHLNAEHAEALNLYATRLLGASVGGWHCVGCDPEGLELQAESEHLRLAFPERVAEPAALRKALKVLADRARSVSQ